MERGETKRARGVDRVISILEYLRKTRAPVRIGELAKAVGAPRSTTYELTSTLVAANILEANERGDVFFGRAVYFYADAYLESQPVTRLGRDEVIRISRITGETTQLCVLVANKYTVAFMNPGSSLFRISSETGVLVPIPWTASGRLLLSGMSDAEILELIPEEDFVLPSGEILQRDIFLDEVHQAATLGVTTTSRLSDPFTTCLAATIRDGSGLPAATICFMVPASTEQPRLTELLDLLQSSARGISDKLASYG